MKSNKNTYELIFRFIIKKIKLILIIILLPQIFLIVYENIIYDGNCVAATKIRISKSVSNLKIVDEIFTENLSIKEMPGVFLAGPHIMITGETKETCKDKYKILLDKVSVANRYIENFYLTRLTSEERSRFSGPILFNSIGGKKIQFASLTPIDFESLKKKKETFRRIYVFIGCLFLILIYGMLINLRKLKNYL